VVWRFFQGASGGGGIVPARAIASDVSTGVAADRTGVCRPGPRSGLGRIRVDGRVRLRLAVRVYLCLVVRAAGSVRAVCHAFSRGGILVSPLLALGGDATAIPMAAVVAGGAFAALLATALLTRTPRHEALV
jgi:hypothetical protein